MSNKTFAIIAVVLFLLIKYALTALIYFLLAVVIFFASLGVYNKNTNKICKSKKSLHGKTVIITGGTLGMGLEITNDLAHRGAKIYIVCPFEEEGLKARGIVISKTGNKNVIFKLLDLSSLESVRNFVENFNKNEDRLDILINNAGVGIPGDFLTKDGMNFIMQVNYFGHFLLTMLLLPLMLKSGTPSDPSRIVNTSSIMHKYGKIDIHTLNRTGYRSRLRIYANSKLCFVYFAHELVKRLKGGNVVINCVDPGIVGTRIFDSWSTTFGPFVTFWFQVLFKNPFEGSQTAIYAAVSPRVATLSGKYLINCEVTKAAPQSYDDKMAGQVWEESVRLVKLTDQELEKCFRSY